ncbi:2'-5' RNA ligase [Rhodanobacter sp. AS-Z3]|uniref:2'-5' RNA ligase family protein n=1 Tax=Rhodanobacter sp. AS-Z3 TaxID=3031330 RepID=UPI00247A3A50|nr:2'-5' RNA ligase [Rhodanobacter sp. AS-Z3]WEN14211.1 2'-5' RNA ligase [Rhodanobacter sp. AS-Z3]
MRAAMIEVGERFCKSHRICATPVGIDSLHLTLCPMGKPDWPPRPLEEALLAAAGEVREQGFTVNLDAAMRFSAKDGQFPFVLCADSATNEAALGLRKAIAAAQARFGLQVSGVSSFLPHVSLLHGTLIDSIEESIAPIQWYAAEFALIRSFFGESRFEVVASWPLASAPKPVVIDLMDELANMPDLPELPDDY